MKLTEQLKELILQRQTLRWLCTFTWISYIVCNHTGVGTLVNCESPLFNLASKEWPHVCKGNTCFKNNNYYDLLICLIDVCLVVYYVHLWFKCYIIWFNSYSVALLYKQHRLKGPTCVYANINIQHNCYKFSIQELTLTSRVISSADIQSTSTVTSVI